MALISFFADGLGINNLNGSGLGFFGATLGQSVEVGSYQDTTFICLGDGKGDGGATYNNKYVDVGATQSGVYNSSLGNTSLKQLTQIPNRLATLEIQFTHDSAVKLQNTKLRIFDRSNINNGASGVVTKVAQLIHPYAVADNNGSGDISWNTPAGSSVIMDLEGSPGMSGAWGVSTTHTDTQHSFYTLLSASPSSIGAKTLFGLYISTEYL
jgi:hypothetical protein